MLVQISRVHGISAALHLCLMDQFVPHGSVYQLMSRDKCPSQPKTAWVDSWSNRFLTAIKLWSNLIGIGPIPLCSDDLGPVNVTRT